MDRIQNTIDRIKTNVFSMGIFRLLNIFGLFILFQLTILYIPVFTIIIIITALFIILIFGIRRWINWANR